MDKFWVDFEGAFIVKAENSKEARNKFWQFINDYNQAHESQSHCEISWIEPHKISDYSIKSL